MHTRPGLHATTRYHNFDHPEKPASADAPEVSEKIGSGSFGDIYMGTLGAARGMGRWKDLRRIGHKESQTSSHKTGCLLEDRGVHYPLTGWD